MIHGILPQIAVYNFSGFTEPLAPYFDNLPIDEPLAALGKPFRRRRFSRFRISAFDHSIERIPGQALVQSLENNRLFGEVVRVFEPLESAMVDSSDFKKLVRDFAGALPGNAFDYEVGVHQIRTSIEPKKMGKEITPVPEGRHRDGFDFVGALVIKRHNIRGAQTILALSKTAPPKFKTTLLPGQLLIFNDREYFHNATVMKSRNHEQGIRDVFVLTAEKKERR